MPEEGEGQVLRDEILRFVGQEPNDMTEQRRPNRNCLDRFFGIPGPDNALLAYLRRSMCDGAAESCQPAQSWPDAPNLAATPSPEQLAQHLADRLLEPAGALER